MKTIFIFAFTWGLAMQARAREEICDCRLNVAEQKYEQYCYLPSPEGPNWEAWGRWTGLPCGMRAGTKNEFMLLQAKGRALMCESDQVAWTTVEINHKREGLISFRIMGATRNREKDIGNVASLRYKRTVRPRGRVFFNYKGEFEPGFHQKTLSIYLSEDNKTLTVFGSGKPYDYRCK